MIQLHKTMALNKHISTVLQQQANVDGAGEPGARTTPQATRRHDEQEYDLLEVSSLLLLFLLFVRSLVNEMQVDGCTSPKAWLVFGCVDPTNGSGSSE